MQKGFIAEVENILGVKIGESFTLEGCNRVFHLDEQLRLWEHDLEKDKICNTIAIRTILNGEYEIAKVFVPIANQEYWTYNVCGTPFKDVWGDRFIDKLRFKNKIVFESEDIAIKRWPQVAEKLDADWWQ